MNTSPNENRVPVAVVVECEAWPLTASDGAMMHPIYRPTLESARHLAAVVASHHGPRCLIKIREGAIRDGRFRIVEAVCGHRVVKKCDWTEALSIAWMIVRHEGPEHVTNQIEWARAHSFINDDEYKALHVLNGARVTVRYDEKLPPCEPPPPF
jgi:hypothetical protein